MSEIGSPRRGQGIGVMLRKDGVQLRRQVGTLELAVDVAVLEFLDLNIVILEDIEGLLPFQLREETMAMVRLRLAMTELRVDAVSMVRLRLAI